MSRCLRVLLPGALALLAHGVIQPRPALAATVRWESAGPEGGAVSRLLADPSHAGRYYASTSAAGLFRTATEGETWEHFGESLEDLSVRLLAVEASDPPLLYARTSQFKYCPYENFQRSTDGGSTWTAIGRFCGDVSFAIDPVDPARLFAVDFYGINGYILGGLSRSSDRGTSWTAIDVGLDDGHVAGSVAIGGRGPTMIYVTGAARPCYNCDNSPTVRRSPDNGATWWVCTKPPLSGAWTIDALAASPFDPDTILLAAGDGLFRSEDAGDSWSNVDTGFVAGNHLGLSFSPLDPDRAYAIAYSVSTWPPTAMRFFRSSDGGRTWAERSRVSVNSRPGRLVADPFSAGHLLLESEADGVLRSSDDGETWQSANSGLVASNVTALALRGIDDGGAYAATSMGMTRSSDGGRTWTPLGTGPRDAIRIAPRVIHGAKHFVLGADQQLWRTDDDGEHYATFGPLCGSGEPCSLGSMDAVISGEDAVVVAVAGSEVFAYQEPGAVWTSLSVLPTENAALYLDPSCPTIVHAIANDLSYRSTDGGISWSRTEIAPPTDGYYPYYSELTFDSLNPSTIYTLDGYARLFRSTNAGATWEQQPAPDGCLHLAVDPFRASTFTCVAWDGSAYRSTDGGESWSTFGAGLERVPVGGVAADAVRPGRLYARSFGASVFVADLPIPTIDRLTPSSGDSAGGTVVTILGSGFTPGHRVRFGGVASPLVEVESDSTIRTTTPPHAVGSTGVTLISADEVAVTRPDAFTFEGGCSTSPSAQIRSAPPICSGDTADLVVDLMGTPPWQLDWSDGSVQDGLDSTPATRRVWPVSSTEYRLVRVADRNCAVAIDSTMTVAVDPTPATPTIVAPTEIPCGSTGNRASVDDHVGSRYEWSIREGVITSGQGTATIEFTAGAAQRLMELTVRELSNHGCESLPARQSFWTYGYYRDVAIPLVVDVRSGDRHFTTDLSLSNGGPDETLVEILWAPAEGVVGTPESLNRHTIWRTLPPRRQELIPDVVQWLRSQGVEIAAEPPIRGTLQINFSSAASAGPWGATARTRVDGEPEGGRFGATIPALSVEYFRAAVAGLRQTERFRSSLGIFNPDPERSLTLSIRLYPASGGTDSIQLGDVVLAPREARQFSSVLAPYGFAEAYAIVDDAASERGFFAWGILNDAMTEDAAFLPPARQSGVDSVPTTVAPIVESSTYRSELLLLNPLDRPVQAKLGYVESLSAPVVDRGSVTVALAPGEQRIIPELIDFLRAKGLPVGPVGETHGGILTVDVAFDAGGRAWASAVASRIVAVAGDGGYSDFAWETGPLIDPDFELPPEAWIFGLRHGPGERANAGVVNLGRNRKSLHFQLELVNGASGETSAREEFDLAPHQWLPINGILTRYGVDNGWIHLRETSGADEFFQAWGVVNDGATPGAGTGDPGRVPAQRW